MGGGEDVACKWVKATMKVGDNMTVSKTWASTAIPGGMARSESTFKGTVKRESGMTVTDFKRE